MKALVTGGSGFIGSTLIEALTSRGIEVDVLMRKSSSDKNLAGLTYRRVEGDIVDYDSVRCAVDARKEIDAVFHLAGAIAAKDRDAFFLANATGTENVARAAADANKAGAKVKRFVYVSSLAGGGPWTSKEGRKETDTDTPISAYGASKREGELALLRYADSFRPVIIRPPMVYGPKDQATFLLVKTVAKRVMPRFPTRNAEKDKFYSVIHARDLVDAIVAVGLAKDSQFGHGEVFYACSGEVISAEKLFATLAESLGVKKTIPIPIPLFLVKALAKAGDAFSRITGNGSLIGTDKLNELLPDYWTCSNRKLMEKIGWRPQIVFDQGMKDAVGWYRQNGWI